MTDLTATERQRRRRAHKNGDHSLCDPQRRACAADAEPDREDPSQRDSPPASLRTRGRQLWRDVLAEMPDPTALERVALEEACRVADRLDGLDRILRGEAATWVRLRPTRTAGEVTVVVDQVLAESRQQAATLTKLLGELRRGRAAGRPAGKGTAGRAAPAANPGGGRGGGIIDLTARIAAARTAPPAR
ncbi:hypothetical protein [Micromonospora haikouensis]|uniref:hypothetical protein n=1 Tax=Micromonospora haikouensis TaxID=686309 RepID=UPI003D71758A